MSYAVRNDKQAWRAVSGPKDVTSDEWYCLESPPDPIPLPPTVEELTELAKEQRNRLLIAATHRMGPLQDAVDEGAATAGEVVRLKQWKQYRIALNRIAQQEGFPADIDWPLSPDDSPAS